MEEAEHNEAQGRGVEKAPELPWSSPRVDESENQGNRCKKGKQYSGQIVADTYSGGGNRRQATDDQDDKCLDSVARRRKSLDQDSFLS